MTLDEFRNAFRLLMNDSVNLPAAEVLREIDSTMEILRREHRFDLERERMAGMLLEQTK